MTKLTQTFAAAAFSLLLLHQSAVANPAIDPKIECKNNTCDTFRVGMYRVRNTETMNLLIEKQKGEKLTIRLTDTKGKVLHEDYVGKSLNKYGQKLNFSSMEDGTYTLEIANDSQKIVKSIFLSTNEVQEVNRMLLSAN